MKAPSIFAVAFLATACGSQVDEIPPSPNPQTQTAPPNTAEGSVDVANPEGESGNQSKDTTNELPDSNSGPATSKCAVKVTASPVYCSDSPLGNTRSECGKFGLDVAGKDGSGAGTSIKASRDAYVAIVKSGNHGCEPGDAAYRIYVDVKKGDTLLTPKDQAISHVTYCACPK